MRNQVFFGSGVAVVTPFSLDNSIDLSAFEQMVNRQIDNKTRAIIVGGTTGEGSSLTDDERCLLFTTASKLCKNKIPVIGGVCSNVTNTAVHQAKLAEKSGVDALLIPTPYFNRASQAGIIAHFRTICDHTDLPIILYDIPARTGMQISMNTYKALMDIPGIVGVKECSASLARVTELYKNCGHRFGIYSGDDSLNLPIYAVGGIGCISVTANILPSAVQKCYDLFVKNDRENALRMHLHLQKMNHILFCENNPSPVKYALSSMGMCKEVYRLPITKPGEINCERIDTMLSEYGLL